MSGIQELFSGMRASSSGLSAERIRMDVIAKNLANAQTTHTPEGGPYRRQTVVFEPMLQRAENGANEVVGVRAAKIAADFSTPMESVHNPASPDADSNGDVDMPNVNPVAEMVDLISASRSYEANLSAQDAFVQMAERALRLAQ